MKRNLLIYIALFIGIIYLIANTFILNKKTNSIKQLALVNSEYYSRIQQLADNLNLFTAIDSTETAMNSTFGNIPMQLPYNLKVQKDTTLLVLRIFPYGCNQCIQRSVTLFEKLRDNRPLKLIILASYPSKSLFDEEYKGLSEKYSTYISPQIKLNTDASGLNWPYFFIYSKPYAKNIFYPNYKLINRVKWYLKYLKA